MAVISYTPESFMIVHQTMVDFSHRTIEKPINLVQYDAEIPVIAVSLYLKGHPYTIPVSDTNITIKVRWGKKGNSYVYKDILGCNAERNVVYFGIDTDMSSEHGVFNPIIELIVTSGGKEYKVGSSQMTIIFDRNPVQQIG